MYIYVIIVRTMYNVIYNMYLLYCMAHTVLIIIMYFFIILIIIHIVIIVLYNNIVGDAKNTCDTRVYLGYASVHVCVNSYVH